MNAVSQQPGSASPVGVATAGYDPGWGYRSSLAFASGASSVWSTQADGIHLKAWSIQLPNGVKMDGDRLYTYDASKDNLSQAGEWSLVHDHLGRLVGASASSLGNYSATYGYDAFDNNTSASVSGSTPPQAIGFTFGALPLNRTPGTTSGGSATGWTYDSAGEATNFAAAPGSSSVTGLQWDGLGRMVQVNAPGLTEQEGYAPSGMRVRRDESVASYSRRFVYTSGGLLLAEYVPKASGGWQWNRDVVYLGSQAIAEVDGAGTHELHSDHLGTPRVITESVAGTATLTGRQNYGPYGETFPAMNSGYQSLTGYTGHVQTDPTGLIYMRGRFYTPIWHRFVNSDQGADPSTWNQMAYVAGSPMQETDPSGMMAMTCTTVYYHMETKWCDGSGCTWVAGPEMSETFCFGSGGDGGNSATGDGGGGEGNNGDCYDQALAEYKAAIASINAKYDPQLSSASSWGNTWDHFKKGWSEAKDNGLSTLLGWGATGLQHSEDIQGFAWSAQNGWGIGMRGYGQGLAEGAFEQMTSIPTRLPVGKLNIGLALAPYAGQAIPAMNEMFNGPDQDWTHLMNERNFEAAQAYDHFSKRIDGCK